MAQTNGTAVLDSDGNDLTTAVGSLALRRAGGIILEEFLPELIGMRGMATLREMAENDPVIGSMLQCIDVNVRAVEWRTAPADDSPQAQEVADFAWECLTDMIDTFPETMSQVFSFLPYGWSWHEMVFKVRAGRTPPPMADGKTPGWASKYGDNRMGFAGWMSRAQDSLVAWEFDEVERLVAMHQRDWMNGQLHVVPSARSLHFRTTARKGNPEGRTILRNAYRPWYFKRRIEEFEAIGIERDLAGLPMAEVPTSLLRANAGASDKALLSRLQATVRSVRRGEAEGLMWPLEYDSDGRQLYKFSLLTSGGARQFDTGAVVTRYDQRILLTAMTDFLLIGHEGTGGLGQSGLSTAKVDLFAQALEAWVGIVAAEINDRALPLLTMLNGWPVELAPRLEHKPIKDPDLSKLASLVKELAAAGMPIFPNPELETFFYQLAGLPVPSTTDTTLD